jgi:hypothetical protein
LRKNIRPSALIVVSPAAIAKAAKAAARQEKAIMMAKTAKFVLVCYILLMFKPVVPLLSDMIAHTFWEKQHLLLVHEVHGRFHIHQELANAGHQSDHEKSNESKAETEVYLNVAPTVLKVFLSALIHGSYLSFLSNYPVSNHRDASYPPPKHLTLNRVSAAACDGSCFGL